MTKRLLLGTLLLLSIQVFSQDKKWSVEANYPISIGDKLGNDNPGIIDLGLKYRFADFEFVKLGAGINAGIFYDNIRSFTAPEIFDFSETNLIIQPKVFGEFTIPSLERFHPSVGLGYSIVRSSFDGTSNGNDISNSNSDGGFNLNLGIMYDINDKLFIQAQYDYINNKNTQFDSNQSLGILKFGVGFRF